MCACKRTYVHVVLIQEGLLDKFSQKYSSFVAYDDHMNLYTRTSDIITTRPMQKMIRFALLHLEPLARALQEMARMWVTSLGRRLHNTAAGALLQLDLELKVGRHAQLTVGPFILFLVLEM